MIKATVAESDRHKMRFSNCALLLLSAAFPTRGVVAEDDPSLSPSSTPSIDPSALPSQGPSSAHEVFEKYTYKGNGFCRDKNGNRYNSITVYDKSSAAECGIGCRGCFGHVEIPAFVGIDYQNNESNGSPNVCSCLFKAGMSEDDVLNRGRCGNGFYANQFNNAGSGDIVSASGEEENISCYSYDFIVLGFVGEEKQITVIKESGFYKLTAVGAQGGDCVGTRTIPRDSWTSDDLKNYTPDESYVEKAGFPFTHTGGLGVLKSRAFFG